MPVDVKQLADLPMFAGLASNELEEIASHLGTANKAKGDAIMKEGEPPEHPIYILLDGTVDVIKHGLDGRDHVISSLAAPSVFGEIEALARQRVIAGVVATSNVEVALLGRGIFDELCGENKSCMLKVVRNLAHTLAYRLAATDDRLAAYFSTSTPEHVDALGKMRTVLYSTWGPANEAG